MVYVNNKPLEAPAGATLLALLELAGRDPARTVAAVDGRFVPRADYSRLSPAEGARVTALELGDGG